MIKNPPRWGSDFEERALGVGLPLGGDLAKLRQQFRPEFRKRRRSPRQEMLSGFAKIVLRGRKHPAVWEQSLWRGRWRSVSFAMADEIDWLGGSVPGGY